MPAHVGPYRIRERLAEGSIASLHRAEHERLGRIVLLKTLKTSLAEGSPLAATLGREAKILSRLAHVSIPRLLDVSSDSDPTWVALEYVDGPSLAAILQQSRRLEVPTAVAIALEVAHGLGHAHARRIVHRNVEPRGIVISPDGRVVLLDFEAAEELGGSAERFERTEVIHGHRYMSPERIMGEPATPQSDVFSLGVVLYEMLCGQGPWDDGKPSPTELSRRIRSEEPSPFSAHGVKIPEVLSHAVFRCLAKRPEERFDDGEALATALDEALDALSNSPLPVLVTRALAQANLGEMLVEDKVRRHRKKAASRLALRPLAWQLGGLFLLVIVGAVAIEVASGGGEISRIAEENMHESERGFLRVLARPWAEVVVDGRTVDVTPMAKPIVVSAGRHYVTFKHPNAPDEKREIMVAPGQTVLVDVTMRVERRAPAANVDAGVDAAPSSP
ncbi:MAG: serine/threonine protein kinase [Polyangiaceae bacterium]|nr:serine/threonine protein kinase [Polyangiaceae bacterium]